uniref:Zinc finger protein 654 n=1 Tax=Oryzias latipes TaxID=8090 RepID=A0A3P9IVA3_ORYLA
MADNESDLETYGLELALDTLCLRYCSKESTLSSKDYCSKFCELVEEYTGQWQVPLPQLKVLRTAICCFTRATAGFPDDCQHIQYVLSSLALSFFELMLFFSKEEFVEEPLKDILDSFQECHFQLLRHRNIYLQHVKQVIKGGGPWENPVLQGILKEADLPQNEVEDFLSSEPPIFLELRVRYLQACERIQEAMTLAKSCLENHEAAQHLYFHQAYLTCLYKASLYENLHKEMAEIDGRDAVEIICNTESVEKDELLLSLCKAFLTRQLHNGDMYYIWDLVFIWSRLYLRAHPSRQGFLTECLQLASSATNVRAIFPFIKLVTAEVSLHGVEVCVELCARALQLCDKQADTVTQPLVCKTIAFLLPHDLEICRACALLVFCQERSLEAYRTVCLLYMHPDQEPHPDSNPVRTNVRFHILQMLKERLCFDPEFWNILTLRTRCLELMSDKVTKAAVLSEMKEEEEKESTQEYLPNKSVHSSCILGLKSLLRTQKYGHLSYRCSLCCKTYKGLNVMRHAISHLKNRKLKCILCGKRFKQFPLAKKHVLDHIDEMCKQKPPDEEPSTDTTPAANGIIDDTKEDSTSRQVDFKDEQVVLSDDLVVIKEPFLRKDKEGGEEQERPAGENGCNVDVKFHLCPSDSCDKVFMRLGSTITKHALRCHVEEEKVLEKAFLWSKRKCSFCLRQIQFYQHYKDHVKLHGASLPYFCYHLECTKRFAQQQELKDHVRTHQPFTPQCQFTDCEKLFSNCQGLFDHEWRHYVPVPQKEELEQITTEVKQPSSEAPWKQRVKVEELWLQSRKGEASTLDVHVDRVKAADESSRGSVPDKSPNMSYSEHCSKEWDDDHHVESGKPTINGYEDVGRNAQEPPSNSNTPAAIKSSAKKCQKKVPKDWDVIDVKDIEDVSTLAEGIQKNMGEPHITEHKTFKPEDPAYAPFVKAPFIRPPPSTYLDESVLSMPKRRSSDQPPLKKYYKKNKQTAQQKDTNEVVSAPKQIRHRCDKCLSSFNTLEELQSHQTLNTCSSLFGFDSDDES